MNENSDLSIITSQISSGYQQDINGQATLTIYLIKILFYLAHSLNKRSRERVLQIHLPAKGQPSNNF